MVIAAGTSGLLLLALLACPVAMGLMMWFMAKGMMGGKKHDEAGDGRSLADLKAEHARLAAKIEALGEERPPGRRERVLDEQAPKRGRAATPQLRERRR